MTLFDAFWSAYPRKTAKTVAIKAWKKFNPTPALVAKMIVAIGRQKESDQWRRGVIPHPATWLNQARWEDDLGFGPQGVSIDGGPKTPLTKQGQETMANLADWLRPHSARIDATRLDSEHSSGSECLE